MAAGVLNATLVRTSFYLEFFIPLCLTKLRIVCRATREFFVIVAREFVLIAFVVIFNRLQRRTDYRRT